jgi:hypothetical protein
VIPWRVALAGYVLVLGAGVAASWVAFDLGRGYDRAEVACPALPPEAALSAPSPADLVRALRMCADGSIDCSEELLSTAKQLEECAEALDRSTTSLYACRKGRR